MNIQIVDDAELVMLESVDKLLGKMNPSEVGLVLARIHGNSAHMKSELSWDLFSIWFEASSNSKKIITRAIAVKLQGGSYRRELYRAWGESRSLPPDRLNELVQRIKNK